jgi:two-component system OmpR family sensor kinase
LAGLSRIPLRVLLPCLAVSLVAIAAAVFGLAGVSGIRGHLMRQTDDGLVACASSLLSRPFAAAPESGPASPGACDMELLSASGQSLTPAAPGTAAGPALPAGGSWLAAHLARPVTVPGAGTSGRWRVVVEAVHYQPQRIPYVYGPDNVRYVVGGRTGQGPGGVLVVMAGLGGIGQVTHQVAVGYAATAGAVLVLLAVAVLALTRAILRPLREAAGLAEATVTEKLRASGTAEAAARRSAEELAERLSEVGLELRMPVSVVRGFAEYYRQRKPRPADVDRMMRRVADEAARMETLMTDKLDLPPA